MQKKVWTIKISTTKKQEPAGVILTALNLVGISIMSLKD